MIRAHTLCALSTYAFGGQSTCAVCSSPKGYSRFKLTVWSHKLQQARLRNRYSAELLICFNSPRTPRIHKHLWVLCGGCKTSPRTTLLCSHIFLVLRDHGVYMFVVYIWKWSSAHALGASVVWHHSLPLMNSFNKTDAAVFSCRLCFLRAFPFISLNTLF